MAAIGDADGGDADGGDRMTTATMTMEAMYMAAMIIAAIKDDDGGDRRWRRSAMAAMMMAAMTMAGDSNLKRRRADSGEGVVAVDPHDDVPQAYAQVGRSTRGRRSRNRHGRARGRIVAPVVEILRRYRNGWVHGGRPRVGLRYNGRDTEEPEDAADGWRKAAHDRPAERRRSAADSVGAGHSSWKASEKQRERRKSPRCSMASIHFQEDRCSKLRDACKKLSVVMKYLMKASVSYFNLSNNPRHERIFSRKGEGPHRCIRLTISTWKMYSSTSTLQAPIRYVVSREPTR
jgi:hypothetical protein